MKNKILKLSLFIVILLGFIFLLNNDSFALFNINNEVFLSDTIVLNEETINLKDTDLPYTILKCTYGIGGTTYVKNTGYLLVINNTYTKDNCNFSVVNASGSGQLAKIYCFNSSTSNLTNNYYYTYDNSSNSWVYYTTNTEDLNIRYDQSYTFYFSNVEIYRALGYNRLKHTLPKYIIDNGTVIFNTSKFYDFDITLSNTEKTIEPITAYSNYFNYEDALNYQCYVSSDAKNWTSMGISTVTTDGITKVRFFYNILENGTYHFKFLNKETNEENYISRTVTNIISDFENLTGITPEITFEPNTTTDKPIIAWTNKFPIDNDCVLYFSEDKENWELMNTAHQNEDGSLSIGELRYWTRIYKNGTYYFRFVLILRDENGELYETPQTVEYILEKKVDFISVDNYMSDDYIFKPIISLNFNEEKQAFIVRTQSIILDKALNLNCFYTTYEKDDSFNPNEKIDESEIKTWNKMEIDFENNIYMGTSDAYFYFEIPIINAINNNYKISFYNYFSEKASDIVYYDFIYEDAKNYVENDLDIHLGLNVRLNDFLKNVESKFGVLGFPISVVRNFSNKILTLQIKEPIIYIPALYDPFYNNKFFDGISFNFNSLLVSDSVIFIHEFYLTIVDMIFIYLFLSYCVKTLKAFIDNNQN